MATEESLLEEELRNYKAILATKEKQFTLLHDELKSYKAASKAQDVRLQQHDQARKHAEGALKTEMQAHTATKAAKAAKEQELEQVHSQAHEQQAAAREDFEEMQGFALGWKKKANELQATLKQANDKHAVVVQQLKKDLETREAWITELFKSEPTAMLPQKVHNPVNGEYCVLQRVKLQKPQFLK